MAMASVLAPSAAVALMLVRVKAGALSSSGGARERSAIIAQQSGTPCSGQPGRRNIWHPAPLLLRR